MKIRCMPVAFALAALVLALPAQTLTTTFASNNGQAGNMFDIVAINDVTICSFDVNIDAINPTETIEVYAITGGGSYIGSEANPANWTLLSTTVTPSAGTNVPTPLAVALNVSIPAGTTQGFYVTCTTSTNINYTNGTVLGAVFASDSNIQFLEGVGKAYPFGGTFSPRVWNGNINYQTGLGGVCPPPPQPPFETNSPAAALDVDGVTSNGFGPAVSTVCTGTPFTATIASSFAPGATAWELVVNTVPVIPRGATINTPTQTLNVDPSGGFTFLNGGAVPAFTAFPGTFTINASLPVAFTISAAMAVLDGANPDGISISQSSQVDVVSGSTAIYAGPATDDSNVSIDLTVASSPTCAAPGAVSLFGNSYNVVHVSSNGRVLVNGLDTDFSPSIAEGLTDNPFIGCWADFNPAAGGVITIDPSTNPGQLDFIWNNVAQFGGAVSSTFTLSYTYATSEWSINGIQGIANTNAMFMGITNGNLGATDGGVANFGIGAGAPAAATDMTYDFAAAGNTLPAVVGLANSLTFSPDGAGNYVWIGL